MDVVEKVKEPRWPSSAEAGLDHVGDGEVSRQPAAHIGSGKGKGGGKSSEGQ